MHARLDPTRSSPAAFSARPAVQDSISQRTARADVSPVHLVVLPLYRVRWNARNVCRVVQLNFRTPYNVRHVHRGDISLDTAILPVHRVSRDMLRSILAQPCAPRVQLVRTPKIRARRSAHRVNSAAAVTSRHGLFHVHSVRPAQHSRYPVQWHVCHAGRLRTAAPREHSSVLDAPQSPMRIAVHAASIHVLRIRSLMWRPVNVYPVPSVRRAAPVVCARRVLRIRTRPSSVRVVSAVIARV
jgi:hypothetical protein